MYQKAIVLLFLLVNTSFAFDTCYVLFVIDGSSYWPIFSGEKVSISTTGNILYSSTDANANFWLYGDGDQDQPIPNWFYSTKDDFLNNLAEVQTNEGKETIVGATAKLNRWQLHNAVIVLYTASPQNLISIAGYNYTEQYRTLAIHLNDGVDMSPISDYPSPQMSEFGQIVELIVDVCRSLPTEGPSTLEPSTLEPITVIPSPSATPCFPIQSTATPGETMTDTPGVTETFGTTETPWETTDTTPMTESFASTGSEARETTASPASTTSPDCFSNY